MAAENIIKRRIKSAKNISQITRSMQMVAASKMKKAQRIVLSARPYTSHLSNLMQSFVGESTNITGQRLIIIFSSDKGLCGGLNTNLFRFLQKSFDLKNYLVYAFGKKAQRLATIFDLANLSDYGEIYLVYNKFVSALVSSPTTLKIWPYQEKQTVDDRILEPSKERIMSKLTDTFLQNQIAMAKLETVACEHSARMLAMKNATDNASDLIQVLTLKYNQARQVKITSEIADIVTARMNT